MTILNEEAQATKATPPSQYHPMQRFVFDDLGLDGKGAARHVWRHEPVHT